MFGKILAILVRIYVVGVRFKWLLSNRCAMKWWENVQHLQMQGSFIYLEGFVK